MSDLFEQPPEEKPELAAARRPLAARMRPRTLDAFIGQSKLVGEGRWSADDVRVALEARDRTACGPVSPPDGLYFMAVDY